MFKTYNIHPCALNILAVCLGAQAMSFVIPSPIFKFKYISRNSSLASIRVEDLNGGNWTLRRRDCCPIYSLQQICPLTYFKKMGSAAHKVPRRLQICTPYGGQDPKWHPTLECTARFPDPVLWKLPEQLQYVPRFEFCLCWFAIPRESLKEVPFLVEFASQGFNGATNSTTVIQKKVVWNAWFLCCSILRKGPRTLAPWQGEWVALHDALTEDRLGMCPPKESVESKALGKSKEIPLKHQESFIFGHRKSVTILSTYTPCCSPKTKPHWYWLKFEIQFFLMRLPHNL